MKTNLKYFLHILGCQMNESDGTRIAAVLEKIGYSPTPKEAEADLIIVIACSVRQAAMDKIYGKAKIWKKLKAKKPLLTVLTGCVLNSDKPTLAHIFDFIFEIKDLDKLPHFLNKKLTGQFAKNYFDIHPVHQNNFQAYVPISTGCNNFCTYCVVPYTRDREKSRPSLDIIKECQELINKGFKEITLLGQNVNSYGEGLSRLNGGNLKKDLSFPELLQKISDLKGDFWVRFVTSHPKDLSDQLIDVIAKNKRICRYLHLPAQSGNNEILKKMNRKYTREHYLDLIKKVRTKIPDLAISTDIIVGFPGETKKQFQDTEKLFREVKYDMAYLARYSPRPGTAAFKLNDNVPTAEKQRRSAVLNKILNQTALANNKKLVGQTLRVLVDNQRNGFYLGKSETFKTVKFVSPKNIIGQFVRVKIKKALAFGLEGEAIF